MVLSIDMEDEEEVPKWAYYICPSCAIYYGTKALLKAIRKRRTKHRLAKVVER